MALAWYPVDLRNDEDEFYGLVPDDLAALPTLEQLLHRPAWHSDAACRGEGTERWFPERGASTSPAKSICDGCLVRPECFAVGLRENAGIWAGMSGRQRRAARRA